tara:strand:- start:11039 stop:12460 length:1422 start_codon:yes stop_codon:yes gene_type:complete
MFFTKTIPTIAIVGRQNVGKSTLYNRITRSRDALVADFPGITRDPKIGLGVVGEKEYLIADTGGFSYNNEDHGLLNRVMHSTKEIALEAEIILFVVDSREGLTEQDRAVASEIRKWDKPTALVANKSESADPDLIISEFSSLGFKDIFCIAAKINMGITELIKAITSPFLESIETGYEEKPEEKSLSISIIGKPNVGKSTLINKVVGYDRMITSNIPGTTRDDIWVNFERKGTKYTFVDTAGLRRKSRVTDYPEKLTALKTLKTIARAEITILVIDASNAISAQDLNLLGQVLNNGKALVIAANKWDLLKDHEKKNFLKDIERRFNFVRFSEVVRISARDGFGIENLFEAIVRTWSAVSKEIKTGVLSKLIEEAVLNHAPPLVRGRRIKLRFAHIGCRNPLTILIYGNQVKSIPKSYGRYLENFLREKLKLSGTPIKLIYRQSENPFAGKKNSLSKRQVAKRRRLLNYSKKHR